MVCPLPSIPGRTLDGSDEVPYSPAPRGTSSLPLPPERTTLSSNIRSTLNPSTMPPCCNDLPFIMATLDALSERLLEKETLGEEELKSLAAAVTRPA